MSHFPRAHTLAPRPFMDDLLSIGGDPAHTQKHVGSDLLGRKETFVLEVW